MEITGSEYTSNFIYLYFLIYILGHMIQEVPEVPLVVSNKAQELTKTKEAVALLRQHHAWTDVLKVILWNCSE